MSQACADKM